MAKEKGNVMKKHLILLLIFSTFAIGLSGCATTQSSQFYLLSSLGKENALDQANRGQKKLSLGIGPINIPKYLNRPQIATRTSNNTLNFAEFHRWAGQLDNNIAQVLAENLSIILTTDQLKLFPWPRQETIDYQLIMDIIQFDRDQNGTAQLLARWSLRDGKDQQVSKWKRSELSVIPKGENYESLVEALSTTLTDLSREIAAAITAIARTKK